MEYIRFFWKLSLKGLKNRLFFDRETSLKSIRNLIFIILFEIAVTYGLYKFVFSGFLLDSGENVLGAAVISITVLFFIFFFLDFTSCINRVLLEIYKSPDLNYLISLPLPTNFVFFYKFLNYNLTGVKNKFLFVLPVFMAIGISLEAHALYYFFIIPVYFLFSLVPSLTGIIIGMIGLKYFRIKIYNRVVQALNLLVNALFWFFVFLDSDVFGNFTLGINGLLENKLFMDLFPITAAANVLVGSIFIEHTIIWRPFFFLVITGLVLGVIVFQAAKGLFYQGWLKNQGSDSSKKKIRKKQKLKLSRSPLLSLCFHEWKMAVRNGEMLSAALVFYISFLALFLYFILGNIYTVNSMFALLVLTMVASITSIVAVSIPFSSMEIARDLSLMKKRYWLYKLMPLTGKDVYLFQEYILLLPSFILTAPCLLIFALIRNIPLAIFIVVLLCYIFVLFAHVSVSNYFDIVFMTKYLDKKKALGSIISMVIPLVYHLLVFLPFLLYYLPENMMVFDFMTRMNSFFTPGISFSALFLIVLLTTVLSRKLYISSWDSFEI